MCYTIAFSGPGCLSVLSLGVSVLQQLVLLLDVSVLQQPALPLYITVLVQ